MTMGREVSRDDLVDDIRAVGEELGRPPRKREYDDRGEYSGMTAWKRFGDWGNALAAAGYDQDSPRAGHSASVPLVEMDPEDVGLSPLGER